MTFNKPNYYNTMSPKGHKHDEEYSPIEHNHDETYSKTNHVHTNVSNDITFAQSVAFRDKDGNELFAPVNSNGNTILGYGSYNKANGKSTHVYGDTVRVFSNNVVEFNKRIKVPVGETGGIIFNNDDTLTYDDVNNVFTFIADNSNTASKLSFGSALIGGEKEAFKGSLNSINTTNKSYFKLGGIMIAYGMHKFANFTAEVSTSAEVSFPKAFSSPPFVGVTINSTTPHVVATGATGITTSKFNLSFRRTSNVETNIFWFAIGACD